MARASGLPTTAALTRAAKTLARTDKVMARLVDDHGPPRIEFQTHSAFVSLARAIVFQQLAGNAARAIFGRVQDAVGAPFHAAAVRALDDATLRGCGLSSAKLAALKDLATKVDDGDVKLAGLSRMADEDVIAELVQVRGIGRWTAEMFLLFKLGRLDVWPVTDYGVQKGYMLAYGLKDLPKPRFLDEKGQAYAGVRSLAAWYFWRRSRDLVGAWRITGDAAYRDGALEGVNALLGGNAQGQVYITGLGNGRASAILHLPSFVDGIDEPVPGLPLFGPQSYLPYQASTQVFGLYYDAREDFDFAGLAEELVPGRDAADADAIDAFLEETIPFWRRYFALEQQLPPYTEFAVHETVGPAVAVTGCLLGAGWTPGTDLPRDPLGAAELEPMRWVMP